MMHPTVTNEIRPMGLDSWPTALHRFKVSLHRTFFPNKIILFIWANIYIFSKRRTSSCHFHHCWCLQFMNVQWAERSWTQRKLCIAIFLLIKLWDSVLKDINTASDPANYDDIFTKWLFWFSITQNFTVNEKITADTINVRKLILLSYFRSDVMFRYALLKNSLLSTAKVVGNSLWDPLVAKIWYEHSKAERLGSLHKTFHLIKNTD